MIKRNQSNHIDPEKTNPACIRLHLPDYQLCHGKDPPVSAAPNPVATPLRPLRPDARVLMAQPGGNAGGNLPTNGEHCPCRIGLYPSAPETCFQAGSGFEPSLPINAEPCAPQAPSSCLLWTGKLNPTNGRLSLCPVQSTSARVSRSCHSAQVLVYPSSSSTHSRNRRHLSIRAGM
ncbi:hypothetical protein BDW42DRAFT_161038 [Aspergillus taichungensis]|uniref:Uncharacterized protein n=1 Tax=Aspergillus taichungensis TaxID=482145 RepID=A0A2J5I600_9EURO|nr:hypothetical protein BDW42DRAFT_161038 [Aspergillus taichungensis]